MTNTVQYIPSTEPNCVLQVTRTRLSPAGQNKLRAVEGRLINNEFIQDGHWPRVKHLVFDRATKKNREHAYAVLLSDLIDAYMVLPGTSIEIL